MAGLELEAANGTDIDRIVGWRLEELKRAGYDDSTALAIAADTSIDLHRATDLARCGCPQALAARILL